MDVTTSKVAAMLLLGGISTLLGFIPMRLGNLFKNVDGSPKHGTLFSSLLCFGGGVLLATSMLHMLPEVRENFENAKVLPEEYEHIPLAEIVLMSGFFLIYFIEEFVHAWCDSDQHGHKHDDQVIEQLCAEKQKQSIDVHRAFSRHSVSCEHIDVQASHNDISESRRSRRSSMSNNQHSIKGIKEDEISQESMTSNLSIASSQVPLTNYKTFDTDSNKNIHIRHSHQENDFKLSEERKRALRDFFTVLALSFHAVLEGLAVGLESDSSDVWLLFAAVATHKYVISFCVGLELYNADTPKLLYAAYMIVYAMMSMIGIAIGIAVTTSVEDNTFAYMITVGVLQAFAGGTILYVCVFEILEREKTKEKVPGLIQLLCVIIGFSVLMMVEILSPDDHGDGNNAVTSGIEKMTTSVP